MNFTIDTNIGGFIDSNNSEEKAVNKPTDFRYLVNFRKTIEATKFWEEFVGVILKENNGIITYPEECYIDGKDEVKIKSIESYWQTDVLKIKVEVSFNIKDEEDWKTVDKVYDFEIPIKLLENFNAVDFGNFTAKLIKDKAQIKMNCILHHLKEYNEVYSSIFGKHSLKKEG